MKTICIISAHSSDADKIVSTAINIKYLSEISDKIVIINSKQFSESDPLRKQIESKYKDINIEYYYCANLNSLCHGKWCFYVDNFYKHDYYNIILTNDSFLVVKSLQDTLNLHNSNQANMTGLVSSRENKWHCQDFFRIYNKDSLQEVISFYKQSIVMGGLIEDVDNLDKKRYIDSYHICVQAEIESCQLFSKIQCKFTLPLSYKKNINFDNAMLKEYLEEKEYPIIKIKKLNFSHYKDDYSKELPEDFDAFGYLECNSDLPFTISKELEVHFMKHGHLEGRMYSKDQKLELPQYLNPYIGEFINEKQVYEDSKS